jgi:hypothetical protein
MVSTRSTLGGSVFNILYTLAMVVPVAAFVAVWVLVAGGVVPAWAPLLVIPPGAALMLGASHAKRRMNIIAAPRR